MTVERETPITIHNAFDTPNNATLYVPKGSKEAYETAECWMNFASIVEYETDTKMVDILVAAGEHGKVVVNEEEATEMTVEKGSDVTLTFVPDEGYSLSQVTVNGEDITAQVTDGSYTVAGIAADLSVTATFTVNKYKVTYLVDDEEYKAYEIAYGSSITQEDAPAKEGYTFSGWSEMPETMPAHDVEVSGSFTVNKYKVTYLVDGEEYKAYEMEYGGTITPEEAPAKEGYTFSGWSEMPETMPAHDVEVTGSFTVNTYTLTYMIGEEVYKQVPYEYGATITPEAQPEGDYKTFEWMDVPETMPAHDVTVTATYETGIAGLTAAQQGQTRIYSPNGQRQGQARKGLNIVVMPNGKVRKVCVKYN